MTKTENELKRLAAQKIKYLAKKRAYELDKEGKFDEHFTLTVFRDLMTDPETREEYEKAVGGDAYQNGLIDKGINKHIAQCIQFEIGAKAKRDVDDKRCVNSVQTNLSNPIVY